MTRRRHKISTAKVFDYYPNTADLIIRRVDLSSLYISNIIYERKMIQAALTLIQAPGPGLAETHELSENSLPSNALSQG